MIRPSVIRLLLRLRCSAQVRRALSFGPYAWSFVLCWLLLAAPSAPAQQARTDTIDRLVQTDTLFTPVSQVYRKSHALLVGINRYKNRSADSWLRYANHDVLALKQMLVDHYGFEPENITVLTDEKATLENIRRALAALSSPRRVEKNDRVLIFFSGHGQTVKLPNSGQEMGFLLPTDADPLDPSSPEDPSPYQSSCLAMDFLWTQLRSIPAKHVLLLADACYSGLLARSKAGGINPQTLSYWSQVPAMEVITGGAAGQTTVEVDRFEHGAFTYELLEELKSRAAYPGQVFTATGLFSALEVSVPNVVSELSGGRKQQTPKIGYLADGEFLFIPTGPVAAPARTVVPLPMPVAGDARAHLSVTSDPPGATVYVDGDRVGQTPLLDWSKDLGAKDETTVKVAIVLDGYDTVRFDAVALKIRQVQPLSATLKRALPVSTPGRNSGGGRAPDLTKYGMELVEIGAGEFTMGSNDYDDEKPVHKVNLEAYYIGKTPVTVKQYFAFCEATGHAKPLEPSWGWKDDHPVVKVSWTDAVAYCEWLSKETGYTVTLPTEAQWEKAARGVDGRTYPWGNDWDGSKCANNVAPNHLDSTMPVGSYASGASIYGVLDMAGNVWQWCSDWYDEGYYKTTAAGHNPPGPSSGQYRVLRGGSWGDLDAGDFRCAFRSRGTPDVWNNFSGFRCVVRADTR
jgi:formylglycine-generating enzyme required for sulfatase activity